MTLGSPALHNVIEDLESAFPGVTFTIEESGLPQWGSGLIPVLMGVGGEEFEGMAGRNQGGLVMVAVRHGEHIEYMDSVDGEQLAFLLRTLATSDDQAFSSESL